MPPRKLTHLAVVLALGAIAAVAWTSLSPRRAIFPPPFPCVAKAKSGWLTAVTRAALLRIEWEPGAGRVGVGTVDGKLRWEARSEAEARALALRVLEPISTPIRSSTSEAVSLFAGCDGVGTQWRGESQRPPSWKDCLRPRHEGRLECVRRVYGDRKMIVDEAAGAVADRLTAEVSARGISLAPARPPYAGPRPSGSTGLIDDLLDRVAPAPLDPEY